MAVWNPWHGCRKISPGCLNCYVYRRDEEFGKDASRVTKTAAFDLPLRKNRKHQYRLSPEDGPVYTCMTSDFFLKEADPWRPAVWDMIRCRADLEFVIITKRIQRFSECVPGDWGTGYENVRIICTCEDQKRTDERLPVFLSLPIRHKEIIHEPMLGPVCAEKYLRSGQIERVTCGGESGPEARVCDYAWILESWRQCVESDVSFHFKQTGALFRKNGRLYRIERKYQMEQAARAGLEYEGSRLAEP